MFVSNYSHYFSIDIENDIIEHNDDETFLQNVNTFVETQLSNLYNSDSNRQYKIKDNTTQVINNINKMLSTEIEEDRTSFAESIARRLLNTEKDVQATLTHLNQEVQKGGLIITSFDVNDEQYFAIVKIHYIDFYEEDTFKENRGLPKKDVILKTSICKVSGNSAHNDFYLSDSTKPKGTGAAKFWWDDFLELQPLKTDQENTRVVFSQVDQLLRKEFHKDHREDYWYFRNNLVSYLRTEEHFVLNTMIDRTLGDLDIELLSDKSNDEKEVYRRDLRSKIEALKEKNGQRVFDTEFTVDKKEVKAKIKRKITLLNNVDLNITGEIGDFKQTIIPEKDGDKKYLKIYTDSGYDAFKSR